MTSILTVTAAAFSCFFKGRQTLILENLALRQQLAVYKRMEKRPRLRPWDRVFWVWFSLCVLIIRPAPNRWSFTATVEEGSQLSESTTRDRGLPLVRSSALTTRRPTVPARVLGMHNGAAPDHVAQLEPAGTPSRLAPDGVFGRHSIHNCGFDPYWVELVERHASEGVRVVAVNGSHPLDLDEWVRFRGRFPEIVICGASVWVNGELEQGQPADVEARVRESIEKLGPSRRLVIAPVCCMPWRVPLSNVFAVREAVEKYGRYPIQLAGSRLR